MPQGKCTPTKRARIVHLHDYGIPFPEIAVDLGLSLSTCCRNYAKFSKTHDYYCPIKKSGRPRKLDKRDLRRAHRAVDNGTARDGADIQNQLFPDVSHSTICWNLCEIGLNGRVRREKPLLTDKHVKSRTTWATEHVGWSLEDWKKVWFLDESQFILFGSDGKLYCRRRPGEEFQARNVKKTVKHGRGSIQVWGCILWDGTGWLALVEGSMNAKQYIRILDQNFIGSLRDRRKTVSDIIFQQDNDPKHTSKLVRQYFEDQGINVLPWPAQSADMSIIKHCWDKLDHQIRSCNPLPTNKDQLWVAVQEEWAKLDVEYLRGLYRSLPRRLTALDDAKGSYTKY